MSVTLVGGDGTGLLDTSLSLLNANDKAADQNIGADESLYVNVSNGNFIVQHRDGYLPSLGEDFALVRTYNSRGSSGTVGNLDGRWELSTGISLDDRRLLSGPDFRITYGDGSTFDYEWDSARNLYVSTDGSGAFETIRDLGFFNQPRYVLTRADQTRLYFSSSGVLQRTEDSNGVRMEYLYTLTGRLSQIRDDQGHRINFDYNLNGTLHRIFDETNSVLVEYRYDNGRLSEVIDRMGHTTRYFYTSDGLLNRIVLPSSQDANGDGIREQYASREINLEYGTESWPGIGGDPRVLRSVRDAEGGLTTFDYDFDFSFGNSFEGGTTQVVDALGNNRAYSNASLYRQWRVENGFYDVYNPILEATSPNYRNQVSNIRTAHSLTYSYREDGYITRTTDQQGYQTVYAYDSKGNVASITDRNGWAIVNSDSAHYRALRAQLGYTDVAGNGKLVASLTNAEKAALREAFTSRFRYDSHGNVLEIEDNNGSITRFTYTSFDKIASITSAMGDALTTSNAAQYQEKRVHLGYASLVGNLTPADIAAIKALYTTTFTYDSRQNLIEQRDQGGDLTKFEYDAYGNRSRQIVFMDAADLVSPDKQRVTQFFYDAFGNNIEIVDPEGNHTFLQYDHFGNLTRQTDAKGGVTTFTYDRDDRLVTITDPEGNTTVNAYDAVGNRISITDARGNTVFSFYDRNNRLISMLDSTANASQSRSTQYTYDVVGNKLSNTDAEGRTTTYIYNARHELVETITAEVTSATGVVKYHSSVAYDGMGNRISLTDNRGLTTAFLYNEDGMLSERKDASGNVTQFAYDANNNQVTITTGMQLPLSQRRVLKFVFDEEDQLEREIDAEGYQRSHVLDAVGAVITTYDENGNRSDFEYDRNKRLLKEIRPTVIDPATGLPTRYVLQHRYDANGNEVELIDENGRSTRFSFDKNDRMVLAEDAVGIKTAYAYDAVGNRTSIQIGVQAALDTNGRVVITSAEQAQVTTFVYDEFNQLISRTDGLGNALATSNDELYRQMRVELGYAADASALSAADRQALRARYTANMTYDRAGNQKTQTDNLGNTTRFTYDALNRLQTTQEASGAVSTLRYDGNGNLVSMTDANGGVSAFEYDVLNRQVGRTSPTGITTEYEYDAFGNVVTEVRGEGTAGERVTRYIYNRNDWVVSQSDPSGNTQNFEYDAVGNRIRITDRRGNSTQNIYDAMNRLVRVIDPKSFETRYEYDGAGNQLAIVDARGGVSRVVYDFSGRAIQTTDAEGRVTRYSYDSRGNQIELRSAFGTAEEQVMTFEYDAENNLRSVVDANGDVVTHEYDRAHNRTATTDGNGHTTHSEFDANNRLIRFTNAAGEVTSLQYDAVGNQLRQTDPNGHVTQWAYDGANRVIHQTGADGVVTTYTYDEIGNRTSITTAAGTAAASTTTFTYDAAGRVATQTDALGHTTSYEYDENNNRVAVTDAHGHTTRYTFDENNRITRTQDPEGGVVEYRYDANGNRVQVIDARGFRTTSYYDSTNRLVLRVDPEGYATTWEYDSRGNIATQTLHMSSVGSVEPAALPAVTNGPSDQIVRFEYDGADRVTVRVDAEGYRTEYAYDGAGNRIETRQFRDLAGTDVAISRSFFDAANREIAQVTAEGYLTHFIYDDAGNLLTRIAYDQPVTVTALQNGAPPPASGDAGRATHYTYDALNRLVTQTSALNVTTHHEYDARGNRIAVTNAYGTALASRTVYVYDSADRLTDIISPLGIVTHYVLDAEGNITDQYDAYGTSEQRHTARSYDGNHRLVQERNALGVVTSFAYDAAGNVVAQTTALGTPDERTERTQYDHMNRVVASVNGEGDRVENTYDGAGNRIRTVIAPGLPEERVNTFEFDRDNRMVAAVDGEGVRAQYRYDGADNRVETIQAAGVLGAERHSFYAYDADDRLVRIEDPLGGVTSYTYDALGNQTRIVAANGAVQVNTFDAVGQLLTSLSAGGTLTTSVYDARGNLTSATTSFADGSDARTTRYSYDLLDRQTRITDGEGFSTSFTYDAFDNQIEIISGQYLLTSADAGYDPAKAARTHVQSNQFGYDAADRLTSMTDGAGNVTQYTYDAVGNRLSVTEASNSAPRTTHYRYDLANRIVETITPEGGITRVDFDAANNKVAERLLQTTEGGVEVWIENRFEYDGNGHLLTAIDSYGVRTTYTYDAVGNATAIRRAAGTADERTVRMEYDLNNRKIADVDGEGNRTEYAYDAVGNRIRLSDALGRVARYYYDGSNRLITVLDPEGVINSFVYDSAGNNIGTHLYATRYVGPIDDFSPPVASTGPSDRSMAREYDGANRAIRLVEADGTTTLRSYDGSGNLIQETLYANTTAPRARTYEYDLNNRLTLFTDVDGTRTEFTWDGANNKTSERIVSAADPNSVRETRYTYDLNNRLVQQAFDPLGLNIVDSTRYDKVGNVLSVTDGNGHTIAYTYNLANRRTSETNALGHVLSYGYDAVGNRTSVTDARSVTTTLVYDRANRLIEERGPTVAIYTIGEGQSTQQLITRHVYDAFGNEVQTIDAAGNETTRYFDAAGRRLAELSADNVLVEWRYNAFGEISEQTLYMTRLGDAAHDPDTRPSAPAGDARTSNLFYDSMGRLTRTVYPPIEVTSVTINSAGQPVASKSTVRPEERAVYDSFGNKVETFDKNGNRSVAYYDINGLVIAQVDSEGYLTEWDYDAQDNVLEQRIYAGRLDTSGLDPNIRPAPPAGEVHTVSRRYDAANRLIADYSPFSDVLDSSGASSFERILTTYTYDRVGNQTSRTRAAGTSEASTEHYYFDAANRQVAVINAGRVLHTYLFDANGNVTQQKRYYNTVSTSIDLGSLDGDSTNFATLVGGNANDQTTARVFDSANRILNETDLMSDDGGADDIAHIYRYDAMARQTWALDGDGKINQLAYDSVGRLTRNISADGTGSAIEYDAAGNQISLFTGDIDSEIRPAENITVSYGDNVVINWDMPDGVSARSWVVWDSASRGELAGYASRSEDLATWQSENGQLYIPASAFGTGSEIFFRVVTADRAGNLSYTEEKRIRIPPRLQSIFVERTGSDSVRVKVSAATDARNLVLNYGSPGSLANTISMVQQADGSYAADINGVTNLTELAYRINWEDPTGNDYRTGEQRFGAPGEHIGIATTLGETTISNGTETRYNITLSTRIPSSLAQRLASVAAGWQNQDISGSALLDTAVTGTDNGDGTWTFNLTLGASSPLIAGNYRIVLTGVFANASEIEAQNIVLDQFNVTLGTTPLSGTRQTLSWPVAEVVAAPGVQGQLVFIDGVLVPAVRDPDSEQLAASVDVTTGTHRYDALYGQVAAVDHSLTIASTEITEEVPDPADPDGPPLTNILGYDVAVNVTLDSSETALAANGLRVAWRPAGAGLQFNDSMAMTATGNQFSATLPRFADGNFDVKVYYVDASGREVIVDWTRIASKTVDVDTTGRSLTVLASETEGSLSLLAGGLPALTVGIYSGAADDSRNYVSLATESTGRAGDTILTDGRSTGYFTENRYNALNQIIATNSETGLWREFGVDANGNRVATYIYGEKGNTEVHDSYTLFDGRNRKIADYGVETAVHGQSTAQRATTYYGYDVFDHQVEMTDANGKQTLRSYSALGLLLREQDRRGGVTLYSYDRLGNETRIIDELGNTTRKSYDGSSRLIQEINGAGDITEYGYDAFDRRVQIRQVGDSRTITSQYSYDHHDRLTRHIDGGAHVTNFQYDKRDNRTGVQDANGNWTYQQYDGLNRVIETRYRQNGAEIIERRQYDAYGNLVAEIDGAGRTTSTTYGAFARKLAEIDPAGRQTVYEYDAFGNEIRQYRPESQTFSNSGWNGGFGQDLEPWEYAALVAQWNLSSGPRPDIRREYDAAGRLIRIDDIATNVSTTYQYDVMGRRVTEDVTGSGTAGHVRHLTYSYDDEGQMTRWHDSATGMHLNYLWDAAGNQKRVYTDSGYARSVNHWYEYDGENRITAERNGVGGSIINGYGYDDFGNRATWNNAGVVVNYQYDDAGRVVSGAWSEGGANWNSVWTYDDVGNVLTYVTRKNGSVESSTTNQYSENNLTIYTVSDGQETRNTFDAGQRMTRVQVTTDGKTNTFTYNYYADGRQREIIGQGSKNAAGTTTYTYDANDRQIRVDKGKGDGMDRAEFLTFVYNNDGQIIFRFHDEGTGDNRHSTEFQYANGNPVGERKNQNGTITELLDTGRYNLVQNLGEDFPTSSIITITAVEGDSLQSIAARMYGNPSLWFVLAEANGLDPSQPIKAGTRITVPNAIETGALTADAHVVYSESDIIGSALPNLKTPKKKSCGNILAIIIIVVIAVVATIVTAGVAGAVAGAVFGTTLSAAGAGVTIASYAIAGAIVGAAASIVQQGLFIALGYQEKFSWKDVAAGAVSGAFTGAAQGVGRAVQLGQIAAEFGKQARVAAAALKVAGEASKQIITSGKITSWASLAGAALAPTRDGLTGETLLEGIGGLSSKTVDMITPWLQAAETYIRDGELTTATWLTAAGSTLSAAITVDTTSMTNLEIAAQNTGKNLLIGGAMSLVDKDTGEDFLMNSIGQEVGNYLGGQLATVTGLRRWAENAQANMEKKIRQAQVADLLTKSGIEFEITDDGIETQGGLVTGRAIEAWIKKGQTEGQILTALKDDDVKAVIGALDQAEHQTVGTIIVGPLSEPEVVDDADSTTAPALTPEQVTAREQQMEEQQTRSEQSSFAAQAAAVLEGVVDAGAALGRLAEKLDGPTGFLLNMGITVAQSALTGGPIKTILTRVARDMIGDFISDKVSSGVASFLQNQLDMNPMTASILGMGAAFGLDVLFGSARQIIDDAKGLNKLVAKRAAGEVDDAAKKLDDAVPSPATTATGGATLGKRRISNELYEELRKKTPTDDLRSMVNKGKKPPFPDEALPGLTVTSKLEADHIVSMDKITRMEGFDKLTKAQQLEVLNNPANFIGLSKSANASKGAKSFAEWTQHQSKGIAVDPTFRARMIQVEQQLQSRLQQQIDALARGKSP